MYPGGERVRLALTAVVVVFWEVVVLLLQQVPLSYINEGLAVFKKYKTLCKMHAQPLPWLVVSTAYWSNRNQIHLLS